MQKYFKCTIKSTTIFQVVLILVLLYPDVFCYSVQASKRIANQSLQMAFDEKEFSAVSGVLEDVRHPDSHPNWIDWTPEPEFTFKITKILFGNEFTIGQEILFKEDSPFGWPEDLVPVCNEQKCILLF